MPWQKEVKGAVSCVKDRVCLKAKETVTSLPKDSGMPSFRPAPIREGREYQAQGISWAERHLAMRPFPCLLLSFG